MGARLSAEIRARRGYGRKEGAADRRAEPWPEGFWVAQEWPAVLSQALSMSLQGALPHGAMPSYLGTFREVNEG